MMYLDEVAAMWRLHERFKDPVRYLTRQIKDGNIRARKIGRHWMMTDADIEHALEVFANAAAAVELPAPPAAEPHSAGVPSLASMRRRRSA